MDRGRLISMFSKAAHHGKFDVVKEMLNQGVVSKGEAEIALRNSIASGDEKQVQTIISSFSNCKLNLDDRLCQAVRLQHVEIMKTLIEMGANPNAVDHRGKSVLMIAIESQDRGMVNHLIQFGADLNYTDKQGNSVAMKAASLPSHEILQSVICAGTALDRALFSAVLHNHYQHVRFLLLQGVNVNETNEMGVTPLITAAVHMISY